MSPVTQGQRLWSDRNRRSSRMTSTALSVCTSTPWFLFPSSLYLMSNSGEPQESEQKVSLDTPEHPYSPGHRAQEERDLPVLLNSKV